MRHNSARQKSGDIFVLEILLTGCSVSSLNVYCEAVLELMLCNQKLLRLILNVSYTGTSSPPITVFYNEQNLIFDQSRLSKSISC